MRKNVYPFQVPATSQEIVSRGAAPREEFRVATREQDELDAVVAQESSSMVSHEVRGESFSAERAENEFSLDE